MYVKSKQNHQFGIYFVTIKSSVTQDNSLEILRQNEVGGVMWGNVISTLYSNDKIRNNKKLNSIF